MRLSRQNLTKALLATKSLELVFLFLLTTDLPDKLNELVNAAFRFSFLQNSQKEGDVDEIAICMSPIWSDMWSI